MEHREKCHLDSVRTDLCTLTDIRQRLDRAWTKIGFPVKCLSDHKMIRNTEKMQNYMDYQIPHNVTMVGMPTLNS